MKELEDGLVEAMDKSNDGQGLIDLQEVGIKWSAYCLRELEGELFKKGMEISFAIKGFSDELVDIKDRKSGTI